MLKSKRKKLKMASLHVNSCKEDAITTGVRLTRYVSKFFDIPFIHNRETALAYQDTYDVLFVKFGILLFCDYRNELFDIYKRAKRIIALEEDYTMEPDYRLTKLNPSLEIWTTMPWRLEQVKGHYLNWNRMTWENGVPPCNEHAFRGLGYYGAYRPDRECYFEKYFVNTPYPVHISTYPRNALKFRDLNPSIKVWDPFKQRRQIQLFEAVLYIEDTFTHDHYCSPANRFYECLGNGVALLIDSSCRGTFEEAGYVIDPFVVDCKSDVNNALCHAREIAALQREQWHRDYQKELFRDFKRVVSKSIGGQYGLQGNYPNI